MISFLEIVFKHVFFLNKLSTSLLILKELNENVKLIFFTRNWIENTYKNRKIYGKKPQITNLRICMLGFYLNNWK
jgi:hypothetical protein